MTSLSVDMQEKRVDLEQLRLGRQKVAKAASSQARYKALMDLGRMLPQAPIDTFSIQDQVQGCQSLMYVKMHVQAGMVSFQIYSDALIALGLAALVVVEWSGLSPQQIVCHGGPNLGELGLMYELTPGRVNGLEALQKAIKLKLLQEYC